ncbi:glutamate-rich protein 2 [Orycteropus afer afer]|uniref:Glutamate-rich protein 2 n=1 Tax=Orycteropus afer afer TaxID=1230840 RepID=A0A8B7ATM6_ORYAF|nr:glutamate-rich protein 2 [Orycteropus afer afer]
MDNPNPFPSVVLEVIGAPADVRPRIYVPKSLHRETARAAQLFQAGKSCPALTLLPGLAPPAPRPLRPAPPPLARLTPPLLCGPLRSAAVRAPPARAPPPRHSLGSACARFCLQGDAAPPAARSELGASHKLGLLSVSDLRVIGMRDTQTEKVMIEPNEAISGKCLFGYRPTLASKLYTPATQVSLNVAKTFSEKKEVSSVNTENKVSLKNTENRVSSKSMGNKDTLENLQSKLWSSSFLKEGTGTVDKNAVVAKQEKSNKYCLQHTNDKLSESTDGDDEDDGNDEDDENSNPNKDIRAPLELMTEFLRAEMDRDYHLAKKLCQMILIYEPENPEAKEFFPLIEEMLLMEKAESLEEDDEDSEEDSSIESEGESSEESSEESSDECEDE